MKVVIATLLSLFIWCVPGTAAQAASFQQDLPTGTIASGRIEPVPTGDLYVGVIDTILDVGAGIEVGGPPGFLVSDDGMVEVAGAPIKRGSATFLPRGRFLARNSGSKPVRVRFIGLGKQGEVPGASYEMEPLSWGPGAGKVYEVTIDRGPFSANSSTPWHYHTGPAFGVLEGGPWENRQVDGDTRRIPTPGYYIQPANKMHQLAQVGEGGFALIVQFFPPGKPKTGGGVGRGDATPTILAMATAISTPHVTEARAQTGSPLPVMPVSTTEPTAESMAGRSGSAGIGLLMIVAALAATGLAALVIWRGQRR